MIKLKIISGKESWKSEAETVLEAIHLLELPFYIKGKILTKVSDGKKATKRMMSHFQMGRLKNNKAYQKIFVKNISLFMK